MAIVKTELGSRAARRRAAAIEKKNGAQPPEAQTFTRDVYEYARCATCPYLDIENPREMFCRFWPPTQQFVTPGAAITGLYPIKNPMKDWCGQHPDNKPVPKVKP